MGSLSPNVTRYHIVVWNPALCITANLAANVSVGVKFGLPAIFAIGPLLIRKRTFAPHRHRSKKCQGPKSASLNSITSLAMANCFGGHREQFFIQNILLAP